MPKKKHNYYAIFSISGLTIGLTTIAYMANGFFNPNYKLEPSYLGNYGDFIGGFLGTFLTIIATVLIYKTYHSQKKELKSQKKELQLQRQLIAQQQFESIFFNMLNVHRELKNGLKFKNVLIIINGIENADFYEGLATINFINKSFRVKYENLKNNNQNPVGTIQDLELEQLKLDLSKYNDINELNILKVVFNKLYKTHQNQISHYCRNIYHILKFIRENEKNKTLGYDFNKYKSYANIFQSQLNVDEQFLLFYNFIIFDTNDNEEYLHPINIVNHYHFLENLGSDNLLNKELHNNKNFYNFQIK